MDKLLLSERNICTKFITPAIQQAGWQQHEFREEVQLADGRVMVRGKLAARIKNPDVKGARTAIWRGGIENCLHQNHVFKARVASDQLLDEWVELVFNSNIGRNYFAGASKQTTNLASINMTQLRSFPLPIPSLAEQKAILEKLTALSAICRTWRQQLEQARKLQSLLAAASIATITGIRTEEEEELKVPKTQLIAKLRLVSSPAVKEQAPLAAILARHPNEMTAGDLRQRFGGEIDAFDAQLKLEVGKGWIAEPAVAEMREVEAG